MLEIDRFALPIVFDTADADLLMIDEQIARTAVAIVRKAYASGIRDRQGIDRTHVRTMDVPVDHNPRL
jgi:hypothetical protein